MKALTKDHLATRTSLSARILVAYDGLENAIEDFNVAMQA